LFSRLPPQSFRAKMGFFFFGTFVEPFTRALKSGVPPPEGFFFLEETAKNPFFPNQRRVPSPILPPPSRSFTNCSLCVPRKSPPPVCNWPAEFFSASPPPPRKYFPPPKPRQKGLSSPPPAPAISPRFPFFGSRSNSRPRPRAGGSPFGGEIPGPPTPLGPPPWKKSCPPLPLVQTRLLNPKCPPYRRDGNSMAGFFPAVFCPNGTGLLIHNDLSPGILDLNKVGVPLTSLHLFLDWCHVRVLPPLLFLSFFLPPLLRFPSFGVSTIHHLPLDFLVLFVLAPSASTRACGLPLLYLFPTLA